MIYLCSYCDDLIRPSDDKESNGNPDAVSHGICGRCNHLLMADLDASVTDVRNASLGAVPACQRLGGL